MADVLGEAVVEILPDIKNFGKDLNKQFAGVSDSISKSAKDIDKEFASISGNLSDSFTDAAKDVDKAWREARAALAQGMLDIEAKNQEAADKTKAAWHKTRQSMSREFIEAGLDAGKSAEQIRKEFERGAAASEKALSKIAAESAKQIEKDMARAAKATEKALKDSAKLAEKEYEDIAKAAKKAADEQEKASNATKKSSDDSGSALSKLGTKITSLTGLFTKMGSAGASIGGLIPIVGALASTIEAAAGAALILPGALVAIGLAGATVKLAFSGIGDAISADSVKELDEAMKNLPSTAQEFVKALRATKDEFDNVRRAVQSAFFQGLDHQIDMLGNFYLPVVTKGLVDISQELNTTAIGFADMLKDASNIKSVKSIFDSSTEATKNLGAALIPITQALLDIADVGAEVFAELTGGAGAAGQKFADFVRELKESGKLKDIMEDGIEALKILGDLLGDVAAIAKNVFGPLIDGAGALASPLNVILDTFRKFTESQDFINMMRDLGGVIGQLSDAFGTVLAAALKAVTPVLAKLIGMLNDHLNKVLPIIVPLLSDFAAFLGDILIALTPLIEPFLKLVQEIMPPLAQLFRDVMSAIDIDKISLLATTIADSLSKAITDLSPKLTELFGKLGDLAIAMGPTIDTFLDFAIRVLPILITGLASLGDFILGFISWALGPFIAMWHAISWVIQTVWEGAKEWIMVKIAQIMAGIELISEVPGKVGRWFGEMREAAVQKIGEMAETVRALPGKILDWLGNLGNLLWDAGARVIQGFIDGLKSRISEIGAILGGITSSIPMLKGPPVVDAKLLTNNGQLIMQGLIDGFKMGEKGVDAHLQALTRDIANKMNIDAGATQAARSFGQMTTQYGAGGAITRAALAESAATRAAIGNMSNGGEPNVDVTVMLGTQVMQELVSDVVISRDKRTKRAVTAGGRRTP